MHKINKKWIKDIFKQYSAQDNKRITNLFIIINKDYLKSKVDISFFDSIELDFAEHIKKIEARNKDIVFDDIELVPASILNRGTIAIH